MQGELPAPKFRAASIVAGVLLIAVGIAGFVVYGGNRARVARIGSSLICLIRLPASGSEAPLQTSVAGATLTLVGPPKAYVGDSVTINLSAQPHPDLPAQKREPLTNHARFRLAGAGLQIEPSDWNALTPSSGADLGAAQWTVRATSAGQYAIVLNVKSTDELSPAGASSAPAPVWSFSFEPPTGLLLNVRPKWTDYVEKFWPGVSTFMGSLLTLPGILSYWQQRKKSKRSRDQSRTRNAGV
jgi:hypothetical protein